MALVNYTFTSLLNADSGGQNTVASEAVDVRFQFDATLATIYSDSAGASPIAQPGAATDANGILSFWALPGYYTITAASRTENVVIDDGSRLNPLVLSDAQVNIKNLKLNEVFEVVERTSGNGGGAKWKVIAKTTENGFNIVTGDATRSLQLIDNGIAHLNQWGLVGDDATDNRLVMQALINYATTNKLKITGDAGIYQFTKATIGVDDEAVALAYPCLLMKSNLFIDVPDGVVFKVADNQSSDIAPFNVPMLYSIEQLENITVKGLTFDGNQANNPLNAINHTWSQIGFSGSSDASNMAYGNDVLIENCKFLNNPGATNIGMGQSENTSGTVGKRWSILNCYFYNNGYKCSDHSSIYGYAEDVLIERCTFDNPDMFGTQQIGGIDVGGQVAYEVHGANTRFINNKVKNYDQGMWVATNKISDADNCIIQGNTFSPIRDTGIGFYRESAPESIIKKILIDGNTFGLTDDATAVALKAAVVISSAYLISDVVISNNICSKVGTSESSSFVNIGPQSVAGQKHTNIKINGNYVTGTTFGVYLATNATNGLGEVEVTNNTFMNLDDTPSFAIIACIAANIVGSNTIDSLTIDGNNFTDINGNCDRGVYLEKGTITNLSLGYNNYKGMILENYTEGATLTVTNKSGIYPTKPFTPVWKSGGVAVTVGNGTIGGDFNKDNGWCDMTAKLIVGSTTTFSGGQISIDLPIPSAIAAVKYIGSVFMVDGGTTRHLGQILIDGTGTVGGLEQDNAVFITDTSPFVLTTGDEIFVQVRYRVLN